MEGSLDKVRCKEEKKVEVEKVEDEEEQEEDGNKCNAYLCTADKKQNPKDAAQHVTAAGHVVMWEVNVWA